MITCCPKCGSDMGFTYTVTIKYQMLGEWGKSAEAGLSDTVAKTQAYCLKCQKRVPVKVAEAWGDA